MLKVLKAKMFRMIKELTVTRSDAQPNAVASRNRLIINSHTTTVILYNHVERARLRFVKTSSQTGSAIL